MKSHAALLCAKCTNEWNKLMPNFYRIIEIPMSLLRIRPVYCEYCQSRTATLMVASKQFFEDASNVQ